MSRRKLKINGGIVRALVGIAVATLSTHSGAQVEEFGTTRVGDDIYQFRFKFHNSFFVVTEDGVVAFDPLNTEAAAAYADEIKRVAPGKPLVAIVYSHEHDDHATGARILTEKFSVRVPIFAHKNTRAPLIKANDPDRPPPTVTFTDRMDLHFGGRAIELHYLGKSHTDNMLVAIVPDVRTAFVVDFAFHDAVGFRELDSTIFPDQSRALERLREVDFDTVVFGHGTMGDKSSIRPQSDYYRDLWDAVERACRAGQSEDTAAASVRLPTYADWRGYDDWFPLNVRGVYRWVAEASPCR